MENITDNLLHWAWYTTLFLGELEKARITKKDISVKDIEKKFIEPLKKEGIIGIQEFSLINPGYLMMLAYTLLVIPKEIMKKNQLSVKDFDFNTKNYFQFIRPKKYN
jgi:hypothetical protein